MGVMKTMAMLLRTGVQRSAEQRGRDGEHDGAFGEHGVLLVVIAHVP
jgi:hypothetical protein